MTDVEMISYALVGMTLLLIVGFILFGRYTRREAESKAAANVKKHVIDHAIPAIKEALLAKKESLEADRAAWWGEGSDSDRMSDFESLLELQGQSLCIDKVCVKASDLIALEVEGSDGEPKVTNGKIARWRGKTSSMPLKNNHWSFEIDGVAYALPYSNPVLNFPDPVKFTFIVAGQMGGDRRHTITCDVREYYELRGYVNDIVSKAFGDHS